MSITLIVEDGTGLENSNTYLSEADADAYFLERGDTVWAALDTELKKAALVIATDYIEQRWGQRIRGVKYSQEQALLFPRDGAYDAEGYLFDDVPVNLEKATAEYAWFSKGLGMLLTPTAPVDATGAVSPQGVTKRTFEKVGPIAEAVEFFSAGGDGGAYTPRIPVADKWMKTLIHSGGRSSR